MEIGEKDAPDPPLCAAYERELAAVAAVHNQVLCSAALFGLGPRDGGSRRIWLGRNRDATRARHR